MLLHLREGALCRGCPLCPSRGSGTSWSQHRLIRVINSVLQNCTFLASSVCALVGEASLEIYSWWAGPVPAHWRAELSWAL